MDQSRALWIRIFNQQEDIMSQYEIYALKYAGPFTRTGAHLMWYRDWDKIEQINYYIWCIRGAGETVVVDAGVTPQMAAARELDGYVNPVEVLARINVKADEVRHVVITHMHFDHAGGVGLFPRATFYIQEDEYRFWREDPIAGRPPFKQVSDADSSGYLASLEGTDRLALLKGDQPIIAGIECLLSPGHTVALQTVAVNTARGTAIIGSDCAHVFRNYQEDWPSALIVDLVGWMKTYDKIRQRVSSPDLLFPGHDRLMAENYPAVARDITRLV
jgi:glyoxylase-like metal-dependent hydrolase (beta-lactamase superfamily II)